METSIIKGGLTVSGTITAISSKSHLHRLIICACLANNGCKIEYEAELSKDIIATISCLETLGAVIKLGDGIIEIVKPIDKNNIPKNPILDCNESGSTARFMLPIVSVLCKSATLTGKGKLPERPFEQLCEALESMGAKFSSHKLPITIEEIANPQGFYEISGNVSSQYISGLLFTLPLCNADGIKLTTELESGGYVNMTKDVMNLFGVKVKIENGIYTADGTYQMTAGELLYTEGDWSNAAFWFCSAKDKPVTVKGLYLGTEQPDWEIKTILRQMGANIEDFADDITVSVSKRTHGVSFDARNFPDIVPILAVRAAVSKGKTVISGIRRLRIKESDRVKSVCDMINALGGNASFDDEHIYIKGRKQLKGGTVDSCNDHRIAMAAAIAACFCENDVEIIGSDAVSKSYPEFFEHYKKMTEENV